VSGVRRDGAATEIIAGDAERVVRQLLLRDGGVSGLEVSGVGLEEAFLTLTAGQSGRPAEDTHSAAMAGGVR
jgi:hypothetical protein